MEIKEGYRGHRGGAGLDFLPLISFVRSKTPEGQAVIEIAAYMLVNPRTFAEMDDSWLSRLTCSLCPLSVARKKMEDKMLACHGLIQTLCLVSGPAFQKLSDLPFF